MKLYLESATAHVPNVPEEPYSGPCMSYDIGSVELPSKPCPDCGALPGDEHKSGCDVEDCSVCGEQAIACDEHEHEHDPSKSKWEGDRRWVRECQQRGWYCVLTGTGRQACDADTPGAHPDFDRWVFWQINGFDGLRKVGG